MICVSLGALVRTTETVLSKRFGAINITTSFDNETDPAASTYIAGESS